MSTYKQKFNRKFGLDKDTPHGKASLSRLTGITKKDLDTIYYRSKQEKGGYSRIYAFIMKTYNGIKENKDKINQDNDLYKKYKKKGLLK